jgi:hypothetical protein
VILFLNGLILVVALIVLFVVNYNAKNTFKNNVLIVKTEKSLRSVLSVVTLAELMKITTANVPSFYENRATYTASFPN